MAWNPEERLFVGENASLRENLELKWSFPRSEELSVCSGQQCRAEGAELPLLCNFLISSKKPWCGRGICINV